MYEDRTVIGFVEEIIVKSNGSSKKVIARIDTGATKSSVDMKLASELRLGPIVESKLVKSAHGSKIRPIVEVDIQIKDKKMKSLFTLADRSHMNYKILIGQNILKKGFLIDPNIQKIK